MSMTPNHVRDVLARARARYVTVLPQGLRLGTDEEVHATLDVNLISFGDARTLYRCRRPICRSIDGQRSIQDPRRWCEPCDERRDCTPQIRIDLVADGEAYRLMLALTSARRFLEYVARVSRAGSGIDAGVTRLSVLNRGHWGELCFAARWLLKPGKPA